MANVLFFQDVNFWGAVQTTFAALPHLKRSRGRIVVTASATGWNPVPRMSFYNVRSASFIISSSAQSVLLGPDQNLMWVVSLLSSVQAANAALINFFEPLRTELGSVVGVTIATPGWIESEMSKGKFLKEHGEVEVDQEMRDVR
jgi:NAD(P)-dependent dehydrogenase (short-subunit alcohol dehydrogenase family)